MSKAPALMEVPKPPQMIDMKSAPHNIKRQHQSQKLYPDFKELKKKKDEKPDTLRRLFDIAGKDWTLDVDNTGAKTNHNFSCPEEDGVWTRGAVIGRDRLHAKIHLFVMPLVYN